MPKSLTQIVKFNEFPMVCPTIDGEPYVLAKSIIEAIGLNYDHAISSLKGNERLNSELCEWHVRDSCLEERTLRDLGLVINNNYTIIPICKVAGWLYSISTNKVNEPARSILIQFQDRCDRVLFEYFFGVKKQEGQIKDQRRDLLIQKRSLQTEIKEMKSDVFKSDKWTAISKKAKQLKKVNLEISKLDNKDIGLASLFDQDEMAIEDIEEVKAIE